MWVQDPPNAAHEDVGIIHPGKTGFKVMMTFFYNTFLQTWWLNLGLPSSGRQSHDTWSKGGSIPGKGDSGSIKAKEYTAREFLCQTETISLLKGPEAHAFRIRE